MAENNKAGEYREKNTYGWSTLKYHINKLPVKIL